MSQQTVSERRLGERMNAVIRVLSGKSSVPLEAIRQGVDAEDVAEWINVSRAAITAAIHHRSSRSLRPS